jgi:DNA-binding winged helix-turn-helix (wHTH) protein
MADDSSVDDVQRSLGEISFQEAQERSGDPNARLLGETLDDPTPEDAAHWVEVYGELIRFKHEVLGVIRARRVHMSVDANIESGVDEALLSGQLARYDGRRREWQETLSLVSGSRSGPPLPSAVPLVLEGTRRTLGHLEIDPRPRTVTNAGRKHVITPTEWQLLRVFLQRPGELLSRSRLAELAWGQAFRSRVSEVEVYISRLRRMVENPRASPLIETVRGAGYRLVPPPGMAQADGASTSTGSAGIVADDG